MFFFENASFRRIWSVKKYLKTGGMLEENQYTIANLGYGRWHIPKEKYDIVFQPYIPNTIALFQEDKCILSGYTGSDIYYKKMMREIVNIVSKELKHE
jgi:hypothetical protein